MPHKYFTLLALMLTIFISIVLSQSTEGEGCPTCKCRHYVWMGLLLIAAGVAIVLLIAAIGVILFKVCVLASERREDDEIDSKVANRIPYNLQLNIVEKKDPPKKSRFAKKQLEEPEEPGKKILGLPFTAERLILLKAYRLLWNEALADFGATASTESIEQIEKMLQLGFLKYDETDKPLVKATHVRYEKEVKKLEPVFEKIRAHYAKDAPFEQIEHICFNLYNTLFRLAHNRGEDVLQQRIMMKPDENPYMTVTPFYMEMLYPAIFRACSADEIKYFLTLLFNESAEACRQGEEIIALSKLSKDPELVERTLREKFPDLNKLAEEVELKKKLAQPELEVMDEEMEEDEDKGSRRSSRNQKQDDDEKMEENKNQEQVDEEEDEDEIKIETPAVAEDTDMNDMNETHVSRVETITQDV